MSFDLKFLPIKDLIFSVIPTVGTYVSYVQGLSPDLLPSKVIAVLIGMIASIILAVIFYRENVKSYKKDLARILATGYFMNFTGKLGNILKSKVPVRFQFPDESVKSFMPENITVEIGIPKTLNRLKKYSDKIASESDIIYLRESSQSEPFWLRGHDEEDHLTIYEYPRTLFAISKYLKSELSDIKRSEKRSKKIFKYFIDQIDELKVEYADQFASGRFKFIEV